MALLHGGSSVGKSDLCCGRSLDVVGRPGWHQSGLMSICFANCSSPGSRKNDLTIYWALGPFVRSFTLLVDPGDICPPQRGHWRQEQDLAALCCSCWNIECKYNMLVLLNTISAKYCKIRLTAIHCCCWVWYCFSLAKYSYCCLMKLSAPSFGLVGF
jgi:hypothetical protein